MQLLKIIEKKQQKSTQKRFEKWKFAYLGNREGFHVITQMKQYEMQYSDSDKRISPIESVHKRNQDLTHNFSQESKSFYTDFSGASLPKTASGVALHTIASGILSPK